MADETKLGVHVFEHNGASLELEIDYEAALKIDIVFGKDVSDWIEENGRTRVGMAKVFYVLQRGEQMTQEEIYKTFFRNPAWFADGQLLLKVGDAFRKICGEEYQQMLPVVKGEGSSKKTRSSSTT